jgi:hypothetical protein
VVLLFLSEMIFTLYRAIKIYGNSHHQNHERSLRTCSLAPSPLSVYTPNQPFALLRTVYTLSPVRLSRHYGRKCRSSKAHIGSADYPRSPCYLLGIAALEKPSAPDSPQSHHPRSSTAVSNPAQLTYELVDIVIFWLADRTFEL